MTSRSRSLRPNRRQLLLAGAVVTASTVAAAEPPRAGSVPGDLAAWQGLSKAIAIEATIKSVLQRDGVFMFGDSIGFQDGRELATRLAARTGAPLAVNNWSGRPTPPTVDALAEWKTKYGLPRRILLASGSNDVFTPPDFGPQVERAMVLGGPQRVVFWVNTQVARTRYGTAVQLADQRNSAWINLQLADAQRRHPNLRIVRWAEYLAAKPNRLTQYLREGIHTTVPAGQNVRNELIVQAIVAAGAK